MLMPVLNCRRVVRGLGRAFLYLSIYPGEVSSLRQAHKTTGPRETKTPRLFTSCELCISEAALLARAIGNSPAHTGVRGLTVTRVTGPTSLDHCTEIQSRKRHTSSAATYVSGTPTLGLYQPRAPRAVAAPLVPGLRGVVWGGDIFVWAPSRGPPPSALCGELRIPSCLLHASPSRRRLWDPLKPWLVSRLSHSRP